MIHWYVSFKNWSGDVYTINIYDQEYNGDPIELTGSSEPFITSEEQSDDAMCTLRYSTGYINIIDKDHLFDAVPSNDTQYYVEVVTGTTIRWSGFIQSQTLDGDMYDRYEEVSIPVVDVLGVMDSIKLDKTKNYDLTMIGNYISEVVDIVNSYGAKIQSIVFPKEWTEPNDTQYGYWLKLSVNRYNWVKDDVPESYLAILQGIAEAFGWSISYAYRSIVFQSFRDDAEYAMSFVSAIKSYCDGTSSSLTMYSQSQQTINIDNEQSVTSSTSFMQKKGIGSVYVKVDPNEKESGLELPSTGMTFLKYTDVGNTRWRVLEFVDNTNYFKTYDYKVYGPVNPAQPTYPNACISDSSYGTEQGYFTTFMAKYDAQADFDKKSYDYKSGIICLYKIPTYTESGIEKTCPMHGKAHILDVYGGNLAARPDGCIEVSIKGLNYGGTGMIYVAFKIAIRIGDHYIKKSPFNNGYEYTEDRTFFALDFEEDSNFHFQLVSNKTKDMLYVDAENLCLPTQRYGVQASGDIFVEFWVDCDGLPNNAWPCAEQAFFSIDELFVKYRASEVEYLKGIGQKDHIVKTENDTIEGEKTVTPRICTKFNDTEGGFAVIYNKTDNLKPGDIVKVSGQDNIEQALHDELSRCYIGRTLIAEPKIRKLPTFHSYRASIGGETYHVLSSSTNWRDCTTKYQLCKISQQ